MQISKAIIPAAGAGTRCLPATKVIPKEMLPIVDKPSIQYVVEEGVKSGIRNFVVVTGKHKDSIADHFCPHAELTALLTASRKNEIIDSLSRIMNLANFIYVRQHEPLGLGHAILTARHTMGREFVSIMLPDDIIAGPQPGLAQLMQIVLQEKCSVIAVQEVPPHDVVRYGVVAIKKQFTPNLFQIRDIVEKPSITDAPSNLAVIGRYILVPDIFDALTEIGHGALGEIQLTDGIQQLLLAGERVFAFKIKGERYDTGSPMGLLKASISIALRHPQYSNEIMEYLCQLDREMVVMRSKSEKIVRQQSA